MINVSFLMIICLVSIQCSTIISSKYCRYISAMVQGIGEPIAIPFVVGSTCRRIEKNFDIVLF